MQVKMESIQQQINILTQKVDRVYQILIDEASQEQPETQMVGGREKSSEYGLDREKVGRVGKNTIDYRHGGSSDSAYGTTYRRNTAEWMIAQQDVPIDSSGMEIGYHHIKEQDLSPQIQIQRLTAQLTAAYNRIAALEEQLLAKRWK